MVVIQPHSFRRFAGRLESGSDIVKGLTAICQKNSIRSAFFSGYGYLRNVRTADYSDSKQEFLPATVRTGLFCVSGANGSVSKSEKQGMSVEIFITASKVSETGDDSFFSARCTGGEVVLFEFTLEALDDVIFIRHHEEKTGLAQWLLVEHVKAGGDDMTAAAGIPATSPREPKNLHDSDDLTDQLILDMKSGDYIDHPRFGQCLILLPPADDKVTVRHQNGKRIDLHLRLFKIHEPSIEKHKRTFKFEMKKK
ncbi:MAG: DUF296 domain-containing protein [Deltaproteobacteria bacterium]|nr:DUF296 domain-containing protein [Deltaproteobacteria bacterium]